MLIAILVFTALLLYTAGSYIVITNRPLRAELNNLATRIRYELKKPTPTPTPATTSTQPEPSRIEITNSPFSRISKEEAQALAASGGIGEITIIYDAVPQEIRKQIMEEASKAGSPIPQLREGPVKAPALAGFFKELSDDTLVLTQKDGQEYTIALSEGARLWIKSGDKLEIVSLIWGPAQKDAFRPLLPLNELVLTLPSLSTPISTNALILYQ